MPQLAQRWINGGDIESVNECWDAALKTLKAYVESAEPSLELVIHDRPKFIVLDAKCGSHGAAKSR